MSAAYDLRSAEFHTDPFPTLAALRAEDPVHWSDGLGGWVLTRYDDVRQGLKDRRHSSDRIRPFLGQAKGETRELVEELGRYLSLWAVFNDPPVHTRLRGLMNKAFTTAAIEGLRPNIQRIVDDLLDKAATRGRMDVIRDFAYPLPASVIGDMLGVPRADLDRLKQWSDDLATFVLTSPVNRDRYRLAAEGSREMTAYFRDLIAERRRQPGDDVTSGLIAAHLEGDRLSADELVANCVLLLFAGHETTTQLIGNGCYALLTHPEQLADLQANDGDAAVVRNAVEEMLRFDGPSLASVRIAAEDYALGGKNIRKGDRLFLFNAAAGRDPAAFPDPDRFDIRREDAGRHVNFGWGLHFCIGAPLARLEAEIAFTTLMRRFRDWQLAAPAVQWTNSVIVRGIRALPVAFSIR